MYPIGASTDEPRAARPQRVGPRRGDRPSTRKLFATEPAKVRPGYANFAIAEPPLKLVLIEGNGEPGTLNHLGVEVESTDEVAATQARLTGDGLATATEDEVACCYAVQDKVWVDGPDASPWEIYTVLADVEMAPGELRTVEPGAGRDCAARRRRSPPLAAADRRRRGSSTSRAARRRRRSAPRCSSPSSSARASPRSASRPTTSDCSCSRTRSRPAPALVALILAFGPVSGAHFNPVVTLADRMLGGIATARCAASTSRRRSSGACVGAMVANLMFELPAVDVSTHTRSSGGALVRRGGRHVRAAARDPRRRARRPCAGGRVRGRRLHRRRVLVHVVDQLRQPRGHDRPHR